MFVFFFFKQKTAYEMRISDWSSDVCSSDLRGEAPRVIAPVERAGAEENSIGKGAREGAQRRFDVAVRKHHEDLAFAVRNDLLEGEAADALHRAPLAEREKAAKPPIGGPSGRKAGQHGPPRPDGSAPRGER